MVARMSTNQSLITLRAERENLLKRIADAESVAVAFRGELKGIDRAIAILKGLEATPNESQDPNERQSRGIVKETVLALLDERREGIKTNDLIDLARARGQTLDRGSVASLLSRLAKEGVINFDSDSRRYSVKVGGLQTFFTVTPRAA